MRSTFSCFIDFSVENFSLLPRNKNLSHRTLPRRASSSSSPSQTVLKFLMHLSLGREGIKETADNYLYIYTRRIIFQVEKLSLSNSKLSKKKKKRKHERGGGKIEGGRADKKSETRRERRGGGGGRRRWWKRVPPSTFTRRWTTRRGIQARGGQPLLFHPRYSLSGAKENYYFFFN